MKINEIRNTILKNTNIDVLIIEIKLDYWIQVQNIQDVHKLMFELTAYTYNIEATKRMNNLQSYNIRIGKSSLLHKINTWLNLTPLEQKINEVLRMDKSSNR